MSTERFIEDQFDHLDNCQRLYDEGGNYLVADFSEDSERMVVHTDPGGFNIFTGTDTGGIEFIELLNLYFPEEGSIYYSYDCEEYHELNTPVDKSDLEVLNYIGDTYGAIWRDHSSQRFPGKDHTVCVYSNDENFSYDADSAEVIADVFPEITDLDDEGDDTAINEAMTMALLDLDRWV